MIESGRVGPPPRMAALFEQLVRLINNNLIYQKCQIRTLLKRMRATFLPIELIELRRLSIQFVELRFGRVSPPPPPPPPFNGHRSSANDSIDHNSTIGTLLKTWTSQTSRKEIDVHSTSNQSNSTLDGSIRTPTMRLNDWYPNSKLPQGIT